VFGSLNSRLKGLLEPGSRVIKHKRRRLGIDQHQQKAKELNLTGFTFPHTGFRVWGSGFRVDLLGFGVWVLGFGVYERQQEARFWS